MRLMSKVTIGYTFPSKIHERRNSAVCGAPPTSPPGSGPQSKPPSLLLLLVPPDRNEHRAHMSVTMSSSLRRSPAAMRRLWAAQARQLHSSGTAAKTAVAAVHNGFGFSQSAQYAEEWAKLIMPLVLVLSSDFFLASLVVLARSLSCTFAWQGCILL